MKASRKLYPPRHQCKPVFFAEAETERSERFWFLVFQIIKHLIAFTIGAFSTTALTYEMPPTWWRVVLWIVVFYISFSYFLYIVVGEDMFKFIKGPKKYSK